MRQGILIAAALSLGLGSFPAYSADADPKAVHAFTQWAMQQVRQEQRVVMKQQLRQDQLRLAGQMTQEMRDRQIAGGPATGTVKSGK